MVLSFLIKLSNIGRLIFIKMILQRVKTTISIVSRKFVRNCSSKVETTCKDIPEIKNKKTLQHDKKNDCLYINDEVAANSIAYQLCKNSKKCYVFEANPGPGLLSKSTLKAGVYRLRAFEKNRLFLPDLKAISNEHNNFEIVEEDMLLLPALEAKTMYSNPTLLDDFFQGIPEQAWDNSVPLRIFSIISNKRSIKFLRFLLSALARRASLYSYGRCELFLLMSEKEYTYMYAEPKENLSVYRWSTVLYNLFFEIKCLEKFNSDVFLSLSSSRGKKKDSQFYLVQLTPKSELFTSVVNGNKLPDLYFFIRHHLSKRTALVIPTLEVWIPHCGPRLIKEGMNVFTKFGDLSPRQLLQLFNQFSSWPEYENSVFHAALERYYGRGQYEEEEST